MKTLEQTATELVEKYKQIIYQADKFSYLLDSEDLHFAKQCALIAVEEIIKSYDSDWAKLDFWTQELSSTIEFWKNVKAEIENLV